MRTQTKKNPRQDLPFGELLAWIPGALTRHRARVDFSLLHGIEEFVLIFRVGFMSHIICLTPFVVNNSIVDVNGTTPNRLLHFSSNLFISTSSAFLFPENSRIALCHRTLLSGITLSIERVLELRQFPPPGPLSKDVIPFVVQRPASSSSQSASLLTVSILSIPTMAPVTIDWAKIDSPQYVFERFPSRRSVVYGTKGVVACSQVRTSRDS